MFDFHWTIYMYLFFMLWFLGLLLYVWKTPKPKAWWKVTSTRHREDEVDPQRKVSHV